MQDSLSLIQDPSKPTTPTTLERAQIERALKRLDRIAHLMDDQFELPILKTRVGLDPIIGLIPGGGDWVVWFVSVLIFVQAYRLGLPNGKLMRMAANIAIDLLGGYVPGIGDVFDVVYKANKRNVELIHAHFGGQPQLDAPLPAIIPPQALMAPKDKAKRAALVVGVVFGLLLLASGPFALLYLLFQHFAA